MIVTLEAEEVRRILAKAMNEKTNYVLGDISEDDIIFEIEADDSIKACANYGPQ